MLRLWPSLLSRCGRTGPSLRRCAPLGPTQGPGGLLPARDAALGPLGAFLGMPPLVSSPQSRPWVASTGLKLTEVVSDITGLTGQRKAAALGYQLIRTRALPAEPVQAPT